MTYLFSLACAGGMTALVLVPHSKDRTKRLLQRGGAAALFGVGLFGSVISLVLG